MRITLISSLAFLSAASALHAESTVAQMGDVEIPASELSGIIAAMESEGESMPKEDPDSLDKFVRALVIQKFVLSKAIAEKHDQDPKVVSELQRTRDAAITESYLRSVTRPPQGYPSEEEISAAYGENKAALLVPKAWHLAQIYISTGEDETASKKRLDAVIRQLAEAGADFASIARVSSDDRSSSPSGGDLGWLQENLIQPPIREAFKDLKLNAFSKPVRMDDGWHIIKLIDSREATTPTLSQVRDQLKARLRAVRSQENRQKFLSELLLENPPAVNGIELRKLNPAP